MGMPFYIVCLDLFTVDAASEAVGELNRLKLENAWLKKTLQELKRQRKEMEKKFAEEKKWIAEIEESKQKLIALNEQIKKIERLNAYAIRTHRGGTLDWVYKAMAASTGALAGVALVSFFYLRKKQ